MKRTGITAKFEEPMLRRFGLLDDESMQVDKLVQWEQQDLEEMEKLRQGYGIPDTALKWYLLALELAREAYPKPRKRGPKTKWNGFVCGALVVEVDRLVAANKGKHGKGLSWALKTISKQKRWANFVERRDGIGRSDAAGIEWYYDQNKKSKNARMVRYAFLYCRETNTLDEWERLVDELLEQRRVDARE
jgi:hypothetical protein